MTLEYMLEYMERQFAEAKEANHRRFRRIAASGTTASCITASEVNHVRV